MCTSNPLILRGCERIYSRIWLRGGEAERAGPVACVQPVRDAFHTIDYYIPDDKFDFMMRVSTTSSTPTGCVLGLSSFVHTRQHHSGDTARDYISRPARKPRRCYELVPNQLAHMNKTKTRGDSRGFFSPQGFVLDLSRHRKFDTCRGIHVMRAYCGWVYCAGTFLSASPGCEWAPGEAFMWAWGRVQLCPVQFRCSWL